MYKQCESSQNKYPQNRILEMNKRTFQESWKARRKLIMLLLTLKGIQNYGKKFGERVSSITRTKTG